MITAFIIVLYLSIFFDEVFKFIDIIYCFYYLTVRLADVQLKFKIKIIALLYETSNNLHNITLYHIIHYAMLHHTHQ